MLDGLYKYQKDIVFKGDDISSKKLKRLVIQVYMKIRSLNTKAKLIIYIRRDPLYLATIIAAWLGNFTVVPLDKSTPSLRLRSIVESFQTCVLLTDTDMPAIRIKNVIVLTENENSDVASVRLSKKDMSQNNTPAYEIFTSGTTGDPKKIVVSQKSIISFMDSLSRILEKFPIKSVLAISSFGFDIHFVETMMGFLRNWRIILSSEKEYMNIGSIYRIIIDEKPDLIQLTPTRITELIQYQEGKTNCLQFVKVILLGGENTAASLLKKIQSLFSGTIFNCYGPTETTIWSMISNVTYSAYADLGHPLGGEKIKIKKLKGYPSNDGELLISGVGMAQNLKGITTIGEEKWFPTGDIVEKESGSGKIRYLGRKDSVIKLLGYRISLLEIKNMIENINGVLDVIVYVSGKSIVANVKCGNNLTEIDITNYLTMRLPKYMIPNIIRINGAFSKNLNGKLIKSDINSEIAKYIIAEIKEEGSTEEVSVHTRINMLDSLAYLRLIIMLESKFNITFLEDQLLRDNYYSIQDLVDQVEKMLN